MPNNPFEELERRRGELTRHAENAARLAFSYAEFDTTGTGRFAFPTQVTFDVDFYDGSLVPGTGTPEPGGGTWEQSLEILRRVAVEKRIVGADVVEHSPLPGNRAPDFLVAKLCYKLLGYSLFPEKVRELAFEPARSR